MSRDADKLQQVNVSIREISDAAVLNAMGHEVNNPHTYARVKSIRYLDRTTDNEDNGIEAVHTADGITYDRNAISREIYSHFDATQAPPPEGQFNSTYLKTTVAFMQQVMAGTTTPELHAQLETTNLFCAAVTTEEVDEALAKCPSGSQPGIDHIDYDALKFGGQAMTRALADLMTDIQRCMQLPTQWKEGLMTLLYKKGSKQDLKNYRPITLLCTMMKLYERVLLRRLTQWLHEQNVITPYQSGFQKGVSTLDQAALLFSILHTRKKQGKTTYLAFLDIQKAFPSVSQDMLWVDLLRSGLSPKDASLLRLLCTNCTSRVQFQKDSTTEPISMRKGVKEGACLSPIEFLLFINDLPKYLQRSNIGLRFTRKWLGILIHADDIVLLAETQEELQKMLEATATYMDDKNVLLSTTKCEIMIIRPPRPKNTPAPPAVSITLAKYTDAPILETHEYKYLGFIFQADLRWDAHIHTIHTNEGTDHGQPPDNALAEVQ